MRPLTRVLRGEIGKSTAAWPFHSSGRCGRTKLVTCTVVLHIGFSSVKSSKGYDKGSCLCRQNSSNLEETWNLL